MEAMEKSDRRRGWRQSRSALDVLIGEKSVGRHAGVIPGKPHKSMLPENHVRTVALWWRVRSA
jgi:hypothetical protein